LVLAQYTLERRPAAWQPPTPELQELVRFASWRGAPT
jgi:hypothetical protein